MVLSDRLWRRRYHADPGVIGRGITISDEAYTIVGVMPPDFEFRYPEAELWTPLRLTPTIALASGGGPPPSGSLGCAGPKRPENRGATDGTGTSRKIERGFKIMVTPWRDMPDQKYKLTLIFVLAAVGLVMLIVCADVGSLLLSRAVQRQKEIAIRASLGAGLWRIVRQLLSESLVLAVFGSLAGIVVARSLLRFSRSSWPRCRLCSRIYSG